MAKIDPLSGFPEFLPAGRVVERGVIDALASTFELHGFANIETRVVEPLDRLAKGGEIDKEIYLLNRLSADGPDDSASGRGALGMHFDLTVPLARYVVENAGHLTFPFRRYQIQPAWRGERPQEGRFRQFTQADVDIIGVDHLPFHHDVEVVTVMVEALARLPLPPLTLCFNNRKLIQGYLEGIGVEDIPSTLKMLDKLDKVDRSEVVRLLVEQVGLDERTAGRALELATISSADESFVDQVRALGVRSELLDTGLEELRAVISASRSVTTENVRVVADLRIARGLDYYTGTVVEIYMQGFEHLKAVGGGGRYDALATDGKTTYPGVGISFGVSRSVVPLVARGLLSSTRPVPSAVLVALVSEEERQASVDLAHQLRARGIACEVAPAPTPFGKQIRFADRRSIPFVAFPSVGGGAPQVKDIRSGVQVDLDPASWAPPEGDLRPTIVASFEGLSLES